MRIVPVSVLLDNYAYLVVADSGVAARHEAVHRRTVGNHRRVRVRSRRGSRCRRRAADDGWGTATCCWPAGLEGFRLCCRPRPHPGITTAFKRQEEFDFDGCRFASFFIPAHRRTHRILPARERAVFTGDTCSPEVAPAVRGMDDKSPDDSSISPDTRVLHHEYAGRTCASR
jgi:hypothetical protein